MNTTFRRRGFYEKVVKRLLDIVCSLMTLILFGWLFLILTVLVRIKIGKPVFFRQLRPGMIDPKTGEEQIFCMIKFRTMTSAKDEQGRLLPDEERIVRFGKTLRRTSLDEIPEIFNILKGDMSFVGPRPFLICDMVFMSEEQRKRHSVKPGLTGLAQINGRNAISWEDKIQWDLQYIEKISFLRDLRIIGSTVRKVLGRGESIEETDLAEDYGDALLHAGKISREEYEEKHALAAKIMTERTI